ncbi:hypothetical protein P7C73_g2263, partial [Tremellales sp. Uapishka_1]
MRVSTVLAAAALSVGYAQALTTGCTTQVGVLALGDLGSCLQLTSLLPLLSASGSIISDLETYLAALCATSTPTCSNSTLTSAQSSISSSCSSDISGGGTDGAEVSALLDLLKDYPEFYPAACSKNSTSDVFTIRLKLDRNQRVHLDIDVAAGRILERHFAPFLGLCRIYFEALKANSSLGSSTIGQGLTSVCGSSFGSTQPSTLPSSSGSASASSSASPTSSSSTVSAGTAAMTIGGLLSTLGVFGSMLAGGYLVLTGSQAEDAPGAQPLVEIAAIASAAVAVLLLLVVLAYWIQRRYAPPQGDLPSPSTAQTMLVTPSSSSSSSRSKLKKSFPSPAQHSPILLRPASSDMIMVTYEDGLRKMGRTPPPPQTPLPDSYAPPQPRHVHPSEMSPEYSSPRREILGRSPLLTKTVATSAWLPSYYHQGDPETGGSRRSDSGYRVD